jgi:large subunit ribosomal protein L3
VSKIRGKGLLGVKVGMTSIFTEAGDLVPVTVVHAGPNTVVAVRPAADGASAFVQLGYGERKEKRVTKPELGVYKKAGIKAPRFIREFRVKTADAEGLAPGAQLDVNLFSVGQVIDVVGTSKGRGFAGVMKRHNMSGQGARGSHGVHEYHRHVGAIGQRKTPGRIFPGRAMPGHMGTDRITVQNLKVVAVDEANHLLMIKGAVPGHQDGLLVLRPAVKPPRAKKVEGAKKPINPMKLAKKGGA